MKTDKGEKPCKQLLRSSQDIPNTVTKTLTQHLSQVFTLGTGQQTVVTPGKEQEKNILISQPGQGNTWNLGGLKEDECEGAPWGLGEPEGADLQSSRGGDMGPLLTPLSRNTSVPYTR